MFFIAGLVLVVTAMLGIIWLQSRPTDEDRFIQTADINDLMDHLRRAS